MGLGVRVALAQDTFSVERSRYLIVTVVDVFVTTRTGPDVKGASLWQFELCLLAPPGETSDNSWKYFIWVYVGE